MSRPADAVFDPAQDASREAHSLEADLPLALLPFITRPSMSRTMEHPPRSGAPRTQAVIDRDQTRRDRLRVTLSGRLDVEHSAEAWRRCLEAVAVHPVKRFVLDVSAVDYMDAAGAGLLIELRRRVELTGGAFDVEGLRADQASLLALFESVPGQVAREKTHDRPHVAVEIGRAGHKAWTDLKDIVSFIGEFGAAFFWAVRHPRRVRWRDAYYVAERAGANALFIVALIGFLMGLIMSFQSAMPLRQFGAEIYVANFLGLSMLRELGPLVTAILLAGRSGSAFAAEIGTMKVNEELSALTTMGLDPLRFLVVTRVSAAMFVTPLLTIFFDIFALVGGGVVMTSMGFPLQVYARQVTASVTAGDLLGGLFKSLVFSLLVGAVGCLRGLRTKAGASAVGESTTSAVVSGIILIAVTDGVFAVLFYALKL